MRCRSASVHPCTVSRVSAFGSKTPARDIASSAAVRAQWYPVKSSRNRSGLRRTEDHLRRALPKIQW